MIDKLSAAINGHSDLLIVPHNDPDPDAIATAVGLKHLISERFGVRSSIGYRGIVGRAENKALVRYLKNPLHKLTQNELRREVPIVLVDTQPGAGNNPLPENVLPLIVIDHHTWRETSKQVAFADVRVNIGASATILTEYFQSADLDIPSHLATALFYGIKTDTMGLGRGASAQDAAAYFYLQPKIDVEALIQIERAQVPASYFRSLSSAIQAARLYENDLAISYIGEMEYPDLGAEIADLLMRIQGIKWVICMGIYEDDLVLSVRSRSRQVKAGDLAQHIVRDLGTAGGHGTMAGGHIKLHKQDPYQLAKQLTNRALDQIKGNNSLSSIALI